MKTLRCINWALAVATWVLAVLCGVFNYLTAKTSVLFWESAWIWTFFLWGVGTLALLALTISSLILELNKVEPGQKKGPVFLQYIIMIAISALVAVPMLTVFQNLAAFS